MNNKINIGSNSNSCVASHECAPDVDVPMTSPAASGASNSIVTPDIVRQS